METLRHFKIPYVLAACNDAFILHRQKSADCSLSQQFCLLILFSHVIHVAMTKANVGRHLAIKSACTIRLSLKQLNKAVLEPRVSPAFAITYFCNHCNIRFENTSKYVDTLTLFSKNLNQRSLTPRWPLTPCLLRSHVWLYPRIIVSKSHDNTSMCVDTVINFAKYHIHIHTTYILHTTYRMSDHIVSYWTQFMRDKKHKPRLYITATWWYGCCLIKYVLIRVWNRC